jgi:hypothetical protein
MLKLLSSESIEQTSEIWYLSPGLRDGRNPEMQMVALRMAKTEAQYQRHSLPVQQTFYTNLPPLRLTYSHILGTLNKRNDS